MIDLIALVVLLIGAAVGLRRGTVAMVLGSSAIFVGAACAWWLSRPLGGILARSIHSSPTVARTVAGIIVFVVVAGLMKFVAWRFASRRAPEGEVARTLSRIDRAGGAVVGATYAAAGLVLVTWALGAAIALIGKGPDIARTRTGRLSARVVRATTAFIARNSAGSPMAARLSSAIAADPGAGVAALNGVVANAEVRRLFTDPALRKAISEGNSAALGRSAAMRSLAGNREFVDAAKRLGVVTADGSTIDPAALSQQLGPILHAVNELQGDADVRRQLADPHMRQLLESRDARAMLGDPGFKALAGRVFTQLGRTP